MMLRIAKIGSSPFQSFSSHNLVLERKESSLLIVNNTESSFINVKRAKLSARKEERIKLTNLDASVGDGGDKKTLYRFCDFLRHPSGIEAILNIRALQKFQLLGSNMYRCTLPNIQLLNFEVAPILDVRVTSTDDDCMVELLACKLADLTCQVSGFRKPRYGDFVMVYLLSLQFEGSNVVERQNDHFSASMTNHITWNGDSDPYLNVDVKLNLNLEIYTQPFTLLPVSAVERPGNLMMQALLDRLVPLLIRQLLQDYGRWVQNET